MTVEPSLLTPQQRLARNRQHILAQMRGSHGGQDDAADAASPPGDGARSSGTWSVLRRSLRAWWRAHPARLVGRQVGRIAEPALHDLAREQPVRLIALAAGAGAAAEGALASTGLTGTGSPTAHREAETAKAHRG